MVLRFGFVKCQRNMANAIATEEDFAIQYNDTIVCDVCKEVRQTFMDNGALHLLCDAVYRKMAKKPMK